MEVHEGGCLCGDIRYRVRGRPVRAFACHCRFCQRRTGTALAVVTFFPHGDVEFSGRPRASYRTTSDESGRWITLDFCPRWDERRRVPRTPARGLHGARRDLRRPELVRVVQAHLDAIEGEMDNASGGLRVARDNSGGRSARPDAARRRRLLTCRGDCAGSRADPGPWVPSVTS